MRNFGLILVVLIIVCLAWFFSPVSAQEASPEKEYSKVKLLLSDAKRASQVGGEASALQKYGEALIKLKEFQRKNPSWKGEEVSAALSGAEAAYTKTLTDMVIKLQNAVTQGAMVAKQQKDIINKLNLIAETQAEMNKFLLENRDLIEKVDSDISSLQK